LSRIFSSPSSSFLRAYWLQVDHQDDNSREPILLAPTPNDFLFPVFQAFAVKDNIRSAEVVSFDFIDISVAEFDLTLEEVCLKCVCFAGICVDRILTALVWSSSTLPEPAS
jgi:hypothetical protein